MLNTEDEPSYEVTVTVADGNFTGSDNSGAYSDSIDVSIAVTDVPEAPELSGEVSVSYAENTAITTAVATYTVTDDEDDAASTPVRVELSGADAGAFTLTDSDTNGTWELAFKAVPDYESPADAGRNNTYNVTVTARDSAGMTDVLNVAVMVTNVDEPGEVSLSTLVPKVGVALTATLTGDQDGTPSRVTWKWERADNAGFGGGDNVMVIGGATSAAYTPVHADAAKYLRATAMYTDRQGPGKSASAVSSSAVDDSNRPPWFDDPHTDPDESIKVIEQAEQEFTSVTALGDAVAATDPEGRPLTYELSGDAALFTIDRPSGQLSVKAGTTLDYETKSSYVVRVKATDPDGASATANVTIRVTDLQETPMIRRGGLAVVGPNSLRYAENGSAPVTTYRAVGPLATMARWSLAGVDSGKFTISSGGVLTFKAPPDYEAQGSAAGDNVYHVTVTANDGQNDPAVRAVIVTVTDIDDTSAGDALLDEWDDNRNGKIDRTEVVRAINAYFNGGLQPSDRAVVIQLMERHFQDAGN